MTTNPKPLPLPADVLAEKLSIYPGLPEIVQQIKAMGLVEYGEPLSVHSQVIVKTLTTTGDDPPYIETHRAPLDAANALDNAIEETIDAACYAIAAQQCCGDKRTSEGIGMAVWQLIHALHYLHQIRQGKAWPHRQD